MTTTATPETIRCGVFETVRQAEKAVDGLLGAGFRTGEISVLCSDESKERLFREFEKEDPAGTHAPQAAATGGVLGAAFGGLVSAGVTTAAGLSILFAGPSFLIGGAVIGGLIGAMQTRGKEKSLSNFYDQSLTDGKLLVGVEVKTPNPERRLERAEQIFRDAGSIPIPLPQDQ